MIPLLAATSAAETIGSLASGAFSAFKTLTSAGSSENFAALLSAHGVDAGGGPGGGADSGGAPSAAAAPDAGAHRLLHRLA